jgi:hypothetical protein
MEKLRAGVFRNSTFNIALEKNMLNFSNNGVLVGDNGFNLPKKAY